MPNEKFNASYPNEEDIKGAEANLTEMQGKNNREQYIKNMFRLGEAAGLSKDEIETTIRTSKQEGNHSYSCVLRNHNVVFDSFGGIVSLDGDVLLSKKIEALQKRYVPFLSQIHGIFGQQKWQDGYVQEDFKLPESSNQKAQQIFDKVSSTQEDAIRDLLK